MKDINERLKLIATAQESMVNISDTMDQWEKAQLIVEKSTFDSINISDKALNLSKEEKQLLLKLKACYRDISSNLSKGENEILASIIEEADRLFCKILDIAYASNEVSHILEREVAYQREVTDNLKNSVGQISKSVEQVVACAEFLIADF